MPKIVNHEERREQLAEAVWRIIRREGLEGVSVRSVASEAGMSLGSLRHYFDSQPALLAFSMRLVAERIKKRIQSLPKDGDPRENIQMLIGQIVPLDEDRLAESQIWMAFSTFALTEPDLRPLSREIHDSLRDVFRNIFETLAESQLLKPGLDTELEAKRFHALVDGLLVHGVIAPEVMRAEEIAGIISRHLDSLLVP
ncbi:HTH-type transcriptional regulator PksA [Paenibacillus tyrfis]|uniref:TetR/AcrR family transcriptional regulator n=1 Tax=Paenibacillus TaxID=44249 RepID=UPI00249095FE|nr:TetR family transcriptional regulator C-terminal domain-containing protein [Paenibacillus tyrfis]GLI05939.1 HTH-type transcriptional regulator PksA [Paenibacillus tyrfis]GMX61339.1 TetR/AcrR family transcriptional regulator [Paenibacillus elgii]